MAKSNEPRYRVGVIGYGNKGTQDARAYQLNPLTEVVAAADPDPENLELFCERFDVPGYSTYKVTEMSKLYEEWAERCGVLPWPVVPGQTGGELWGKHAQVGRYGARPLRPAP